MNDEAKLFALLQGLEKMRSSMLDKAKELKSDAQYNESARIIQSMMTLLAKDIYDLAKAVGYQLATPAEIAKRKSKTYTYEELLRVTGIKKPNDKT